MKRIVDVYRKHHNKELLWTYIVFLGSDGTHPSIDDFKKEAISLAVIDKRGGIDELEAYVHSETIK
jgi:hypothetical protein